MKIKKKSFPTSRTIFKTAFLFFTHAHKPIIIFLIIFCQIFFDLSLSLSFFPLPFFFISSFVTHFIVFLLHGIVAGQPSRKGTNFIFKK